ncbi:hypothetical protein ON010_g14383 [Phytophthora cinnamomi]|nr:hypothetical protein ON010_g14383 [Phytophthora cinnamomi]
MRLGVVLDVQAHRERVDCNEEDVDEDNEPVRDEDTVRQPHDVVGNTGVHHVHVDENGGLVLEYLEQLLHWRAIQTDTGAVSEDADDGTHALGGLTSVAQAANDRVDCQETEDREEYRQSTDHVALVRAVVGIDGQEHHGAALAVQETGKHREPHVLEVAVHHPKDAKY